MLKKENREEMHQFLIKQIKLKSCKFYVLELALAVVHFH